MDNAHTLVTSYCIKGVSTVVYPVSDLSRASLVEGVHDVGDGGLVAILADADGNMIGLDQAP